MTAHAVSVVALAVLASAATISAQAGPSGPFGRRPVFTKDVLCLDTADEGSSADLGATVLVVQDAAAGTRHAASGADVLTLSGGTSAGLRVGESYLVRRRATVTTDAPTRPSQTVIRTAAWITVTAADERYALARIDGACDAVLPGDALAPYAMPSLPAQLGPSGEPMWPEMARVLFGRDGRRTFANGDVFTIDRGTARGVVAGTRMIFYRDTKRGGPLVEVGRGIALTAGSQTTTVIATTVLDGIRSGDWAAIRGDAESRR